jgi:transcriptional regulator with XRE-family HTH domain
MQDLGPSFRRTRVERGLSLAQVSSSLGVHPSLLSRYERGVHAVPPELVAPWATLLELRVVVSLVPLADGPLADLQEACRTLSPEDRDLVTRLVARLAG